MPGDAIEALNARFAVDGARIEAGAGGLPRVIVDTPACHAALYLHGAQVTEWRPADHDDVLWLSPIAAYLEGAAIRGGVPICFPWFGRREGDPSAPSHGLARTRGWDLASIARQGDTVVVTLTTHIAPWSCTFTAALGDRLSMTLTVRNAGSVPAAFEAALHAYFAVADVRQTQLTGLEPAPYEDMATGGAQHEADGAPLRFAGETDRRYRSTGSVTLVDPVLHRRIQVDKSGSRSTVVWNPWAAKAAALNDLGDPAWQRMLCIEPANIRDDVPPLAPGGSSAITATISVIEAS